MCTRALSYALNKSDFNQQQQHILQGRKIQFACDVIMNMKNIEAKTIKKKKYSKTCLRQYQMAFREDVTNSDSRNEFIANTFSCLMRNVKSIIFCIFVYCESIQYGLGKRKYTLFMHRRYVRCT